MSSSVDERISKLEKALEAQAAQIKGHTSQIATLKSQNATFIAQIATFRSQIATLKSQDATFKSQIATLKSQNATFNAQNATFKSQMEGLTYDGNVRKSELCSIFKSTVIPLHKAVILKAVLKEVCGMHPSGKVLT